MVNVAKYQDFVGVSLNPTIVEGFLDGNYRVGIYIQL
jgi:hypothetical protein